VPVPLFDITGIDLNATAVSYEQVGEINPHRGEMRQLHHVIWFSEGLSQAVGVKYVRDDEFWVAGHIPGKPLFPGVLMIETGAQLCSVLYKLKTKEDRFVAFMRCDDVTFRGQVVPGDTLHLLSTEVDFRPRRFVAACQGLVGDTIVFEAKITGIAL
jgi:3-hydroxyacyl-[acyl-carrier-protein] dehydratase